MNRFNDPDRWRRFGLPKSLSGKSFIDIGCWEGFFCVEALKRGASRVVGLDMCTSPKLLENLDKYDFEFVQMDIQSEKFLTLPQFDVVSFCGVLYHHENPMSALFRLRKMVKELLVVETLYTPFGEPEPFMKLWPTEDSTWWSPNITCLKAMLKIAGFEKIQVVYKNDLRVSVTCVPGESMPLEKAAPRRKMKMERNGGHRA